MCEVDENKFLREWGHKIYELWVLHVVNNVFLKQMYDTLEFRIFANPHQKKERINK